MFLHGHYGIMTVTPANMTGRTQTALLSPREVTDDWMMWPIFDPRRPPGNSSTQQKSAFPLRKRLRDWERLVATTQTTSRDFLRRRRTMRNYARDWRNLSITPLLLWHFVCGIPEFKVSILLSRYLCTTSSAQLQPFLASWTLNLTISQSSSAHGTGWDAPPVRRLQRWTRLDPLQKPRKATERAQQVMDTRV